MNKGIEMEVCFGFHEDFSSNARSDILKKYSRFHSKTEISVRCNSPDVMCISSFRKLVYEIDPHNITCRYKEMFENASVLNLLHFDDNTCLPDRERVYKSSLISSGRTEQSDEPDLSGVHIDPVDKSNSCIYSCYNFPVKSQHMSGKSICGWETCQTPHCIGNLLGYLKVPGYESQEINKQQGKSAISRELSASSKSFPESLRFNDKQHRSSNSAQLWSRGRSSDARSEEPACQASISTECTRQMKPMNTGVPRFKHFRRNASYMDQYREEYTYKNLREKQVLPTLYSCGRSCCLNTSSGVQHSTGNRTEMWKDVRNNDKETRTQSGNGAGKWKPMPKKRQPPASKVKWSQPFPLRVTPIPFGERFRVWSQQISRPEPPKPELPKPDQFFKKTAASHNIPRQSVLGQNFYTKSLSVKGYNLEKQRSISDQKTATGSFSTGILNDQTRYPTHWRVSSSAATNYQSQPNENPRDYD